MMRRAVLPISPCGTAKDDRFQTGGTSCVQCSTASCVQPWVNGRSIGQSDGCCDGRLMLCDGQRGECDEEKEGLWLR
ncbi:hypothetical protein HBI52_103000 [Parastagonospora nodorum]|nr:hypothetical protein HBH47_082640 [Parastagonospora nodorum]KAH4206321.1 hypothetical protein HBI95_126860 [Parastagonospora nodorum]KAH5255889.1 hypothetical protein HBI72_129900 [Parastagonospora nodorum]KAH5324156.1 hypothetical protein HBI12_089320 [Parastagonospora nodorum]KAH5517041.1 hypothetical protein HBI52_103000 [Parastagonospora nodorum]